MYRLRFSEIIARQLDSLVDELLEDEVVFDNQDDLNNAKKSIQNTTNLIERFISFIL